MYGATSPARPWFELRVADPGLNEFQPVRIWLDAVRDIMVEVFIRSNIYTVLAGTFLDLGVFGTSAFCMLDDEERGLIWCRTRPRG